MLFTLGIFVLGLLLMGVPFGIAHFGKARSEFYNKLKIKFANVSTLYENGQQTEESKMANLAYKRCDEKADFWYDVWDNFTEDAAHVVEGIGITLASIALLVLVFMVPISISEVSDLRAQYTVYEEAYDKWQAGELKEPPYSNTVLMYLQEQIEAKRYFREEHPWLSCYFGHELDGLDTRELMFDREYDRIQVDK